MTDEEMMELMHKVSQEENFRATVYTINSLLFDKGIFSHEEYDEKFKVAIERQIANRAKRPL